MSDEPSHPTTPLDHTLRPHHIDILGILSLVFKDFVGKRRSLPPAFQLFTYRLLLCEISEASQPRPRAQLVHELENAPDRDDPHANLLVTSFAEAPARLDTTNALSDFFGSLPSVFVEKSDEEPPIVMRRSLFGYFARRCFVSFLKLSFAGLSKLLRDYQAWARGQRAGYESIVKNQLDSADLFIWKTKGDYDAWSKPDGFELFEKAAAVGDDSSAIENLRSFFEQHFHEGNDSGLRQHALLHLVRIHYIRGEYAAARQYLKAAITTARVCGDKLTLQHCMSMQNRLPPESEREASRLNEIQPDLHFMEVLFDVKKLLDDRNEQPLSAAFARIVQAMGVNDHNQDRSSQADSEQWAQHLVQSLVWREAGCLQLAKAQETIALAFTDNRGDDHNKLVVNLNHAYNVARQGGYDRALAMLLDSNVWSGITLADYGLWAQEVWHVLALKATRRGQDRLYEGYLLSRCPDKDFTSRQCMLRGSLLPLSGSKIEDPLLEVIHMRDREQAACSINSLLTALWYSEFLGRLHLYRVSLILLADVGLEFGLTHRCKRILDEIMPQIITGDDLELRALACFTLARCTIAAGDAQQTALEKAVQYLTMAESDYKTLQMYRSLVDVLYLLAVIYHNLGREEEMNDAIERRRQADEELIVLERASLDDDATKVMDVVYRVGAALSAR